MKLNAERGRMWENVELVYWKRVSGNLPGVSEEFYVNFFGVVGVSNMIGSGYLPNTNLKCNHLSQRGRWLHVFCCLCT
jgi:hypothetical protein